MRRIPAVTLVVVGLAGLPAQAQAGDWWSELKVPALTVLLQTAMNYFTDWGKPAPAPAPAPAPTHAPSAVVTNNSNLTSSGNASHFNLPPPPPPLPPQLRVPYPNFDKGSPGDTGLGAVLNPAPRDTYKASAGTAAPADVTAIRWPVSPTAGGSNTITSAFGERWVPGGSKNHGGIDLNIPQGTPIGAATAGRVMSVSPYCSDRSLTPPGGGCIVSVRRDDGTLTKYMHLSKSSVKVGDRLNSGQTLGLSGNTGHSTGAHLHFEVCKSTAKAPASCSQRYNPLDVLDKNDPRYREGKQLEAAQRSYMVCRKKAGKSTAKLNQCQATWRKAQGNIRAASHNRPKKLDLRSEPLITVMKACNSRYGAGTPAAITCSKKKGD